MEPTTFFEHYRSCPDAEEAPNESGGAIKAIDTRTNGPIALQLIPRPIVDQAQRERFEERARAAQKLDHINIAKIFDVASDDDYLGVVSEYLEGETAASWIVAHGPMPADAVLRIGIQVVRAVAAAAFHGLVHRAIEPANLMVVPGQTDDGGWPAVKLLNFGLAGSETFSDGSEPEPLTSSAAPRFASPEQRLNRPIDFRAEMYSLGLTMLFLATGAVPLAADGMIARFRTRRLPELRRAPRALRNLLRQMLRENPANRPQDPVAFEAEMANCLAKIERRQSIGRKLGIPLAAVIPRSTIRPATPLAQVVRGTLAFVALLLAATALGAFLLPADVNPFRHKIADAKIIGVPESVPNESVATKDLPAPEVAQSLAENPTPVVVAANESSSPEPPTQGPDDQSSAPENSGGPPSESTAPATTKPSPAIATRDAAEISSSMPKNPPDSSAADSATPSAKKAPATVLRHPSTAPVARVVQKSPNESRAVVPHSPSVSGRARFVGMTPDGRMVLRLPSGRTVVAVPRDEDSLRWRRRVWMERRAAFDPDAPFQPFNPGN